MQTTDDVEAGPCRIFHHPPPLAGNRATDRSHTDEQAANAGPGGFGYGHVGNTQVHAAAREAQLARDQIRPPLDDAQAGLGIGRIVFFSDQDQVGGTQLNCC